MLLEEVLGGLGWMPGKAQKSKDTILCHMSAYRLTLIVLNIHLCTVLYHPSCYFDAFDRENWRVPVLVRDIDITAFTYEIF